MEGYSLLNMDTKQTILILEDNDDRIAGFEAAVARLGGGFDLKLIDLVKYPSGRFPDDVTLIRAKI